MKQALVAFVVYLFASSVHGRPLIPEFQLREDLRLPQDFGYSLDDSALSQFEFEDASQTNGFLRAKRDSLSEDSEDLYKRQETELPPAGAASAGTDEGSPAAAAANTTPKPFKSPISRNKPPNPKLTSNTLSKPTSAPSSSSKPPRSSKSTSSKATSSQAPSSKVSSSLAVAPTQGGSTGGCFPAVGTSVMQIPSTPATASNLASWWCDQNKEYAFMGFSYAISSCPSAAKLASDFKTMRQTYKARYVRIYSTCDQQGYYNGIVNAAADAGIGVYALLWFGFDGDDSYKGRLANIMNVIQTNPKAPYVIRNFVMGSEPLFDWALSADALAALLLSTKKTLSNIGMQVSISEMPYGYQIHDNAPQVFKAQDLVQINALPFFNSDAGWGGDAWGSVQWILSFFAQNAPGKLRRITQTGWPSNTNVWKANSPNAQATVASEKAYFDMLDSQCSWMKGNQVGWFAHVFNDEELPGWGIIQGGKPKFNFAPRVTC